MSLTVQFYTMLSMIGMGAWVGAALDTYHRFLQRPKRKRWLVFFYDFLFWVIQALTVFYTLLLMNEAELRFYVFIALMCGFAAYQSLLKKMYVRTLEAIIQLVIRTYKLLASLFKMLIISPVIFLAQLVITLVLFLLRAFKTILRLICKLCVRILFVAWKIVFGPLRFIGALVWKVLPNRVKIFIRHYAGFLRKIKKMKVVILKWWSIIKKRLGGPRE
jgi:spore cortex biosynthesis protein YabQ